MYPVRAPDGTVIKSTVHLNQVVDQDNFHVGEFTYASDFDPPENWAARLAPYLFPGKAGTLTLGRFCQIAHGTRFITSGANHATNGISTYPFPIFDAKQIATYQPDTRDTVIGHDVWFGMNTTVMPGARIGCGCIIGAGAVVAGDIQPYSVVVGNPGRVKKRRFDQDTINRLIKLAWWHWDIDQIAAARGPLMKADIQALEALAH